MIKLKMIQEDVDGANRTTINCPIARVLKRMFPGKKIAVTYFFITIGDECFKPPTKTMQNFMNKFDHCKEVKPTNFNWKMERVS